MQGFRFFLAKAYKRSQLYFFIQLLEVFRVELSAKKLEQLNKQPIVETTIRKSEDGKWVIHKTTITDIKPISYFEKVLH